MTMTELQRGTRTTKAGGGTEGGPEAAAPASRVTIVRPSRGFSPLSLGELWERRELLYFLVWRNIKVRYKQTILGAAWAVLQPLSAMVVFSVFLGRLAHVPSDGLPYALFAYTALVPWTYFANALTQASNSLVEHERMLTKVYFPRLTLPLAAVLGGLVDLGIAFAVLIVLASYYGVVPTAAVLALPAFVLLAATTAAAVGLWFAALNVRYRDVRYITPFLVQLWMFATPVLYPSSLLPDPWRAFYGLNPMVGVVEGFRWSVLGSHAPGPLLPVSVLSVLVLLFGGLWYFRRTERTFADVI